MQVVWLDKKLLIMILLLFAVGNTEDNTSIAVTINAVSLLLIFIYSIFLLVLVLRPLLFIFCMFDIAKSYPSSSVSASPIVPLVASFSIGLNVAPLSVLTMITGSALV